MAWLNFLEKLFPTTERIGNSASPIIINIQPEMYYKELAVHTAISLISNAISRSEIKVFEDNKPVKNEDYFLLNVSPNKNETSSYFWHKVINKVVRAGKALVIEAGGCLYCADSFTVDAERPVLGDIYCNVQVGNMTFEKKFNQNNSYMIRLNDRNVTDYINQMYNDFGKILKSAAEAFKRSNGQKYRLKIADVQTGDEEFKKEFEDYIKKELEDYLKADSAIYPEFDGYELVRDDKSSSRSSEDIIKLKEDLFLTTAHAFHIPDSLMTGNVNNMKEVMTAFLSFGADPYADMITEALNKGSGKKNYIAGNYYKVDTSKVKHHDMFEIAEGIAKLISSGIFNIDELRDELGYNELNTEWSKKYFMTKNFSEITNLKGGE